MNRFNLKDLTLILLIAFSVWSSSLENCCAREGRQYWRQSSKAVPASVLVKKPKGCNHARRRMLSSAIFNVLDYGAKGDGQTDDTKVCMIL